MYLSKITGMSPNWYTISNWYTFWGRYLYQLWSVDCIIVCIPNQIKLEFELSGCTRVVLISLSIISFEGEKLSLDISSRLKTSNLLPAFYLYKIKDLSNELHLIYLESLHSLR
jgi:hypothetical protein